MRATAWTTSAVLLTLVFVTCMPASAAMTEKNACCAAMEHACGEPSVEMPCCSGQTDQVRGLVATKAAAVAFELAYVDAPSLVHVTQLVSTRAAAGRAPVHPNGSPTYLLTSALRL